MRRDAFALRIVVAHRQYDRRANDKSKRQKKEVLFQ
jgi:hypothetical protein